MLHSEKRAYKVSKDMDTCKVLTKNKKELDLKEEFPGSSTGRAVGC